MAKLTYGPAKKFLYNCQYLIGKEVRIRTRKGAETIGTITGFGATGSIRGKIELWAKVKDNKTGRMMQVDLMVLYKNVPRGAADNHTAIDESPKQHAELAEAQENGNSNAE
ncbi:MAG TPA: hypothetical protein VI112_09665 [Bacteroidia bacterium]